MKYWLDTEFIARPFAMDLVSIGIVAEDGREFYAQSAEVDWSKASRWALEHVRPQLDDRSQPLEDIAYGVQRFVGADEHPEFWGFYCAFDWVALCGLFGSLTELPFGFPQYCLDIKQWAVALGNPPLPDPPGQAHHALIDARWTRGAWYMLDDLERGRAAPNQARA